MRENEREWERKRETPTSNVFDGICANYELV